MPENPPDPKKNDDRKTFEMDQGGDWSDAPPSGPVAEKTPPSTFSQDRTEVGTGTGGRDGGGSPHKPSTGLGTGGKGGSKPFIDGDTGQRPTQSSSSEFELQAHRSSRQTLSDRSTDDGRAGEAHARHRRMIDECRADLAIACDQVEHPGREIGVLDDAGQVRRRQRYEFRWLPHHGVAVGERCGQFPCRHQERVVERGNGHDGAHRTTLDERERTGARWRQNGAGMSETLAGEERERLSGTVDLAFGFSDALTLLLGDRRSQFDAPGNDQVGDDP